MIIEADFMGHWKTRALMNAVGKFEALQALLLLWGHCQTRKAWEFELTPLMLAGICNYEGEAAKLWGPMQELGWIEPAEELGWFRVHDWGETNASLVGKWAGGARERGATWHPRGYVVKASGGTTGATIASTSGATIGSSRTLTGSTSGQTTGPTDRIGEDRIGLERNKSTPKAPKGADTHFPLPQDWSEGRKATMMRWVDYRREIRKPVKAASWQAQLVKLEVLNDEQLADCVADSMANGWQGLFPEKFTLPPPTGEGAKGASAQKKEGAAPPAAKKIAPPDFPWRAVAMDHEGWTPQGDWEDQTPRTRQTLRDSWRNLPPHTKAALCALADGGQREVDEAEKREGGAGAASIPTPPDWQGHFKVVFGPDAVHPELWVDVPPAMQRQVWAHLEQKKGGAAE